MIDLSTKRGSRQELEAELRVAGAEIKGKVVKCPFHEDKHPSGGIYEKDGVWRFKCHTSTCGFCGDIFDVRARHQGRALEDVLLELEPKDESAPKTKRVFASVDAIVESVSRLGEVDGKYQYANPNTGTVEVVQIRLLEGDGKRFLTHRAAPGGFVLGAPPKPWPLYNRCRARDANPILVVEGEKCVHALHDIGIVATTSLSGAQNADKADWSLLAGKKIYIWPDNDEAGHKYARAIVDQLEKLNPPASPYLLNVTGLGLEPGGDVVDFIADGATAEEIWRVLEDGSQPAGAHADLFERIECIINGSWQSFDWPWPILSRSCKSLFPGTITVICGDPSASKSFLLLEAMHHWHRQGIAVDLLELEEDRPFHLLRLLAVLSGTWDVLDDGWGRMHAPELTAMYAEHERAIQSFGPRLHAAPLGQLKYRDTLEWIEKRCKAGAKILGIDPITAISTGENRQIEDLSFIVTASNILRDHGARLILVTHPRQSGSMKATQDDVAGGRAFSRHTQTVLMLHRKDPPEDIRCKAPGELEAPYTCNRIMRIAKARNAPGHGWRIGMSLGRDVRFQEHGIVVEAHQ